MSDFINVDVKHVGVFEPFEKERNLWFAIVWFDLGLVIAGGPIARNFERVAPALGVLSMAFGVWYALGALGVVVYPF